MKQIVIKEVTLINKKVIDLTMDLNKVEYALLLILKGDKNFTGDQKMMIINFQTQTSQDMKPKVKT